MFRSGDPSKRGGRVTWSYDKCLDTKPRKGWIAGPCQWVEVHHIGRSFPCLPLITDGEMVCKIDHAQFPLGWIGYQPLYSEIGKPVLIGIQDYMQDAVAKLKLHQPVTWGKGENKYSPTYLLPRSDRDPFHTTIPWKMVAANCWPGLVVMWKDPELRKLFELTGGVPTCSRPMQAPSGSAAINEEDEDVKFLRAKIQEAKQKPAEELTPTEAVDAGRVIDYITAGIPAAKHLKNGKHPKPK